MTTKTAPPGRATATTAAAAILIASSFALGGAHADEKADSALPGMTYASIEQLPDFGGWWYLDLDPSEGFSSLPRVLVGSFVESLKPEPAEQFKRFTAAVQGNAAALTDALGQGQRTDYCAPMIFAGFNGGFEDNIEFLFTPGRVTIASELGLIRRVFLNRTLPADVDETMMGTSVGHWEGATLVVETTGLDHDGVLIPIGRIKIGRGARIVERIALKDADTLEIARRIVAPEVLTGPADSTLVYRRDRNHVFHEASHCASNDRSVDPETGRQRFDLTPPADLPPPPQ